jgi:hypothetical protein
MVPKQEDVDMDPALADWLKIEPADDDDVKNESDSATDDDSDNADVADGDDLDDWFNVKKSSSKSFDAVQASSEQTQESVVDIKMGESDTAMEYDQDLIFTHLSVFSLAVQFLLIVLLKVLLSRFTRECSQEWHGVQVQVREGYRSKVQPIAMPYCGH